MRELFCIGISTVVYDFEFSFSWEMMRVNDFVLDGFENINCNESHTKLK